MKPSYRIAIADDCVPLASMLGEILTEAGHDIVLIKHNGVGFLNALLFMTELPDICVLDYQMKGLNGAELCREIKQQFETIKVIGFSFGEAARENLMRSGCDYFLHKENGVEALLRVMRTYS